MYLCLMSQSHLDSLYALRSLFERDEDWVALGHVVYLLELLSAPSDSTDGRIFNLSGSISIH